MQILVSIFVTLLFFMSLMALQVDIAVLFGVQKNPNTISLAKDILTPIFTAFGGALSGAYIAYKLSIRQQSKSELDKDHAHLVNAFNTLLTQLNDLLVLKKDVLLPYQDSKARALMIPKTHSSTPVLARLDSYITYIAVKYNAVTLAQSLSMSELKYLNTKEIQSVRNDVYYKYIQAQEEKGVKIFESVTLKQASDIFGINNLCNLYHLTEEFIKITDESILHLKNTLTEISELMGSNFKGYKSLSSVGEKSDDYLFEAMNKPYIQSVKHLKWLSEKDSYEQNDYQYIGGEITFNNRINTIYYTRHSGFFFNFSE